MISFLLYKSGAVLANRLPVRLSEQLTAFLSTSQYYLRFGSRRNVIRNMRLVAGCDDPREARRLAKAVFSNFGRSIYAFLRLPSLLNGEPKAACEYGGVDDLVRTLTKQGGFVIAGPHVGPWEMAGACLSALGLKIHTAALAHPSRRVSEFFDERRGAAGIVCHPVGNSFGALCDAVKRGECVALLIDRAYGKPRGSYTMFGREVALPAGHAAIAVHCGVPVLTAVCVFGEKGGLRFVFRGPHYPDPSKGEDAAVEEIHGRCRADMEELIRAFPEQWFHFAEFGGKE
jgi:lauroyl/myristoyl acyltransferase